MRYNGLNAFLCSAGQTVLNGPVAMIFAEDEVEIDTTLRHHCQLGFKTVLGFLPARWSMPDDLDGAIHRIDYDLDHTGALETAVNAIVAAAPGQWMYYGYNAEYLFYPFCETRTVSELLTHHAQERRDAMLTYVIDLYAPDLERFPNAVSLDEALLDQLGYYALCRTDPAMGDAPKDRQMDFFGGLRWRFEEHVPQDRRRIDRIGLFRAKAGLQLRGDHTFSDEEYNTYACPWHNNLTASIASFRTAKALKRNPGSSFDIATFRWHNSTPFAWHSRQLMDLGLMEPGQWF